jgi:hypothetical protein
MSATFTEWGVRYEIGGDAHRIDPCEDEEGARDHFATWPHIAGAAISIVKREVTYGDWEDEPTGQRGT